MLKIVIKTEIPEECRKNRYSEFMTLKRVQTDIDGRVKALVAFESMDGYKYTIVKTHECKLAKALLGSGAIVLSAHVKRDEIFWTLVCTWEEFKNLVASLNDLNLSYELVWKSRFFEDKKLSRRELEILKLALEHGYFENPKKVRLKELAKMLGISEATASNLIRRALKKVVDQVLTNYLC